MSAAILPTRGRSGGWGKIGFDVVADLLFVAGAVNGGNDEGAQPFSEVGVIDADHGGVQDLGVIGELNALAIAFEGRITPSRSPG